MELWTTTRLTNPIITHLTGVGAERLRKEVKARGLLRPPAPTGLGKLVARKLPPPKVPKARPQPGDDVRWVEPAPREPTEKEARQDRVETVAREKAERYAKILKLWDQGCSIPVIRFRTKCSKYAIDKVLKDNGRKASDPRHQQLPRAPGHHFRSSTERKADAAKHWRKT